jgi:transposase
MAANLPDGSRVRRESHARFCERPGAKFPWSTQPTVPVLAQGQTDIARVWVYVRDDRPFGGSGLPCAVFYYSRDRAGIHPQTHLAGYSGIFEADAYGGYNKLYEPNRSAGPIIEAACWSHGRRKFFELADLARNAKRKAQGKTPAFVAPMALAAVQRIDALFEIERSINLNFPCRKPQPADPAR